MRGDVLIMKRQYLLDTRRTSVSNTWKDTFVRLIR